MAQTTILPLTGSASTGSAVFVGTAKTTANFQCNPQVSVGFSGTVVIESSSAPSPGANDWATVATLVFSNHTDILNFDLFFTNKPWWRVRLPSAGTLGRVAVHMAY